MLRIILGIISLIYIVYIFYLRDKIKKGSSIIYLREAPSKDSPAYVGKVLKERVDGNDIISTILDLNMRKYIDIEVQIIDGKEKRVLKNNSKNRKIELDEHEQYIINRLFRTSDTAILEDYINSSEFKKDFKTFDKILDKKTALRKNKKTKNIKQINKILFLSTFIVLGTFVFYALIEPISLLLKNTTRIKENIIIILSAILAISAFVAFLNLYIKKLTTSSNNANTIALNVAYILVFVVFGIVILCLKPDKIYNVLVSELSIVNVVFSFILAVLSLAYMLNIIKHEYKEKIVLYLLCLCAVIAFVLNSFVSMCIVIVILSLYSFYTSI